MKLVEDKFGVKEVKHLPYVLAYKLGLDFNYWEWF